MKGAQPREDFCVLDPGEQKPTNGAPGCLEASRILFPA